MSKKVFQSLASLVLALAVTLTGVTPAFAAPLTNDNFANADVIASLFFSTTFDITEATNEGVDEPSGCFSMERTVWYSFIPDHDMTVRMNTAGSQISSNVNAYQLVGAGISDLTFLQCAYFGSSGPFFAEAGQKYYFQVGSPYGEVGNIQLNVDEVPVPAHDNFAAAIEIDLSPSQPFSTLRDITAATNEGVDEPSGCFSMDRTLWYSFIPAQNMIVNMSTYGSEISSNVNAYLSTGLGINNLNFLTCASFSNSSTFLAEAGQKYYLQIGSPYLELGAIALNLEASLPLANDNFANAAVVPSPLPFIESVDTSGATIEAGEPIPSCEFSTPGPTAWYDFTPATSGSISVLFDSVTISPIVAAYTGNSLASLTEVGCQPFGYTMTFHVDAGTTYHIQVGGFSDQVGTLGFQIIVTPPPTASFYYSPSVPSVFDSIQFNDNSGDPGNLGFQSFTWNFGDGTNATATDCCVLHQYAKDGDYTVQHTVTTLDGRSASTSQLVQVRTHDVAISKFSVPQTARTNQTKTINVEVQNKRYSEYVQVTLVKGLPGGGEQVIGTLTLYVPAKAKQATIFKFSYTFTPDDAAVGKVTFKAVANLVSSQDAFLSDNTSIVTTTVSR